MKRVLFAGYAPVHFVCFEPIYRRLIEHPDVHVDVSGGREADKTGLGELSAAELYRPFGVPEERIVELPEMLERSYDFVFSAHISGYFPKEDRRRVQVFHGLSFRNMAVRRDVLIYDNLFVAGPYMMRAFLEAKLFRAGDPRLVPTGFVKVDRLVDGSLDRGEILGRLGLDGERPVILYAPTGQKGASVETTGPEVIRRLRDSGRYDIIVKLHDHPRDRTEPGRAEIEALVDEHTRLVADFDIIPYLFVADLLISDASSVSSEYSLMDRPMVFLDVPELLRDAEASKKGRFDLGTWGRHAGIVARWPDQAVEAVERSLENPEALGPVRRAMAADLFYNPGRATDAAVRWTLAELGVEAPAPLVGATS